MKIKIAKHASLLCELIKERVNLIVYKLLRWVLRNLSHRFLKNSRFHLF